MKVIPSSQPWQSTGWQMFQPDCPHSLSIYEAFTIRSGKRTEIFNNSFWSLRFNDQKTKQVTRLLTPPLLLKIKDHFPVSLHASAPTPRSEMIRNFWVFLSSSRQIGKAVFGKCEVIPADNIFFSGCLWLLCSIFYLILKWMETELLKVPFTTQTQICPVCLVDV